MTKTIETELKLAATPAAIATLLADPAVFGTGAGTKDQLSTYHDTPGRALAAAGLSLRVRRIGERHVQTMKAEGGTAASLFARTEWEQDIAGDVPELDAITEALAGALGGESSPELRPIFNTEVTRTAIVVTEGESCIELVADRGRIVAGDRNMPIGEIELELQSGDRHALFTVARRLAAIAPLRLGVRSKSERGYALLLGDDKAAVKSEAIPLSPDMDAAGLFAAVAGACIRHFRLNEDQLIATGAVQPLHQARVALRRLRSALSIFRDLLQSVAYEHFRRELRWISGLLGEVRNLDVLIPRIADPATVDRLRDTREVGLQTVVAALDSPRMHALMLDLVEWIAVGGWRDDTALADARAIPALTFANDRLDALRRRVKRRGRAISEQSEEARHEVRIAAKKLRYGAEFFAGLYPGRKAARRRDRFLDHMADLQEALGSLNDIASGRDLLAGLGIDPQTAFLGGKPKRPKRLIAEAEGAWEKLIDEKRFWR